MRSRRRSGFASGAGSHRHAPSVECSSAKIRRVEAVVGRRPMLNILQTAECRRGKRCADLARLVTHPDGDIWILAAQTVRIECRRQASPVAEPRTLGKVHGYAVAQYTAHS